jgi:hypothetical protein
MRKTLSIPLFAFAAIVAGLATLEAVAIPPPNIPVSPLARKEPDLLTEYERKTLAMELQRLTRDVKEGRRNAEQDPSLEPLKAAVEAAKNSADRAQIAEAQGALAKATEEILNKQEGIPGKIRRLLDVGKLLRYDQQDKKEQRIRSGSSARRLVIDGNTVIEIGPPPVTPVPGANNAVDTARTATNLPPERISILPAKDVPTLETPGKAE